MGKTIKVRITATPVSNRSVRVRTSVSGCGLNKTKYQTIRMK